MKVLISPDSFKGTISSVEASSTIEKALKQLNKEIETICLPIADGGEGTLDAFVSATNGTYKTVTVQNPIGKCIEAQYGVLGDQKTCVIEMAQASGITLLTKDERNPYHATTYGTGQLIKHALDEGYTEFIIGIGGSATNDAGIGMLHALGVQFLDENNEAISLKVSSLRKLRKIDVSALHPKIKESHFTIACDVDNPLVGENGATAVFGPQKGVKETEVIQIDTYIEHFADVVEQQFNIRLHDYPGAGAAGGLGGALKAFFPSTFKKGIDVVLEAVNFEEHIQGASFVITGEGKSDIQTLSGKAPMGIAQKAATYNVPTILVSGYIDPEAKNSLQQLFQHTFSVVDQDIPAAESFASPLASLEKRVVKAFQSIL